MGIHPVFHISQLKKHLGSRAVPDPNLPLVDKEGRIKIEPSTMIETRAMPRPLHLVTQWLIQWVNLPPGDSTWEDTDFMKGMFPEFYAQMIRS